MYKRTSFPILCLIITLFTTQSLIAQRGNFGGRGGRTRGTGRMGGFNMGRSQERQLIPTYDQNGDGWLNLEERNSARRISSSIVSSYRTQTLGEQLNPTDVQWYAEDTQLYDITTLRTLFFEFENQDWEAELEYFHNTDVEVPAKLTVDGKTYENVGVRFRGNTSYSQVATGKKRPLNISMDYIIDGQDLYGYRTLNLHNGHNDPTFMRQVLYQHIANQYIPALKANYVRVVINGESWGIYINYQQFNTDFTREVFGTSKGARWKVPGSPNGNGGLVYSGENLTRYKSTYEIKSEDDPNSWAELINLCRILNQTPTNQLPEAIEPILDVDGVLRFLAIENVLVNSDGYWTRASDYLIYKEPEGKFHIIPYDTSETMSGSGGGGRGGFGGGGGVTLQPFSGAYDSGKPLLSRLLTVPSYQQLYLGYIRNIAENWLNWETIGPLTEQYEALIADDIENDMRKNSTTAAFYNGIEGSTQQSTGFSTFNRRTSTRSGGSSLKSFVEQRSQYLLGLQQVRQAGLS